jgi:diguanylate cyclase (GGDEF)-like protein
MTERAGLGAVDRRYAGLDELTGIYRRETGALALAQQLDRSRRLQQPMVLAMIDVDALKAVNDAHGEAAGDALLRDVVTAITSTTRSYDVTMRWGGDEFICALSGVTPDVASERVAEIKRALDALRDDASLTAGLAELQDDDTLETLIARADTALDHAKTAPDR